MSTGVSWLLVATSSVSTLLIVLLDIVFLVAVLTVVAKHRKDAVVLLASAVGLHLFGTVFSTVGYSLGNAAVSQVNDDDSIDRMSRFVVFNSAMHVATALVYLSATVCMLLGVLKLAKNEPRPI